MIDIRALFIGIILVSLIGVAFITTSTYSVYNVESDDWYAFSSNPDADYDDDVGNGLTLYGERIYIENYKVSTGSDSSSSPENENEAMGAIHFGDTTRQIYDNQSSYSVRYGDFRIDDTRNDKSDWDDSTDYDHVTEIRWSFKLDIPKDRITGDITNVAVEDVGPGEKKVTANVEVENDFNPIYVEKMSANVLGKKVDLDTGLIEKGVHNYNITASKDYYDSSTLLKNERVTGSINVYFKNPRIPQDMVSGKPDQDGNRRTYESFESGGATPELSVGSDYDGLDYIPESSDPCDIKHLRQVEQELRNYESINAPDAPQLCEDTYSWRTFLQDTQNWDMKLDNFQSESTEFNFSVQFCGEKASYVDGECKIDEDLHLRGDLCPLLSNHQIVTETFNAGTDIQAGELSPEPSFFCTKHPVLVTDPDGKQTNLITDPYKKLVDGETVEVPDKQTYTLYWTVDAEEVGTSFVCEEGTFDKETGDCEVTPGVVHKCGGDSVWDPQAGSCVVHPETSTVCDHPDARYNSDVGKCVFPKSAAECPPGTQAGASGETCWAEASVTKKCPEDVNGTVENGQCVAEASVLVQNNIWGDLRLVWFDLVDIWDEKTSSISSAIPI